MPEASLIIVAWDNFPLTQRFVSQCLGETEGDVEVIVIDNGSTDLTTQWLDGMTYIEPRLTFIHNTENQGYPRALNQGLMIARGDYLVCLNNDLIVLRASWLQELLEPLRENPKCLVGARMIEGNEQVNVDGWTPDYLEGWCLAFHRQFLSNVGWFDEGYSPAFVEDVDLCWRAECHGYEVMQCPAFEWGYEGVVMLNGPLHHLYGQTTYITHRFDTRFWEITPPNIARFRAKVRAGDDGPCYPKGYKRE